jgi:hypothetical protein
MTIRQLEVCVQLIPDAKKREKHTSDVNSYTSWKDTTTCFRIMIELVITFIVNFFLPQSDTN